LGTAAYQMFDFLKRFDGRTFGEFEAAANLRLDLGQPAQRKAGKSWALGEVRWCLDHDYIRLEHPKVR